MDKALTKKTRWFSPIWLVPAVAVAVAIWMLMTNEAGKGPEITVDMETAEGIEVGKTLVKVRNVEVGRVDAVNLSEDLSHAVVTISMQSDTERMLNSDTELWVVKPRVGRDGVSGLSTILSGAYIQLQPGSSDDEQRHFVALTEPPVAPKDAPGVRIELTSERAGALGAGDSISYRGLVVGQVEKMNFDIASREVSYDAFIRAPYHKLVTDNVRFWNESGISLSVGSRGVKVDLGSIEALLGGGVTFDVIDDQPAGEVVTDGHSYPLFDDKETAIQQGYNRGIDYVLFTDESISGLEVGAPIEYRGLRVGTVTAVPYKYHPQDGDGLPMRHIPIKLRIEPDRLKGLVSDTSLDNWQNEMQTLFDDGLRASLRAGNLLTNVMYIDLNFYPERPTINQQDEFDELPVFPSVVSDFARIEQKISQLLDKFNELPIEPVLTQLEGTLGESTGALKEFSKVAASLEQLLGQDDTQALPGGLRQTLEQLNKTLADFQGNGGTYQQLNDSLQQLNHLLRDVQPLIDTLNEQPNALIFNKAEAGDPQPRANHD
ncbi:intermembrane transport protein PqiB [Idiomarina xiamenensis]|uniref:Mce/MlaD domain-containing protein n=1 Tax=Idiomarina xiamenensis 10-D-4 TaxID=740709 RepID=K2K842_9GAMM|nr:intermembrane transport protein PqiB [Idiomarina xiamenensis]EKE83888.1 hypothetical protein A10D4_07071 [Idiomarina xiamenensis 10-D-4]